MIMIFGTLVLNDGISKIKNITQNKNKNCIRHTPCLRKSIAYDQDFWYTWVKWCIEVFFSLFRIFIFWVVRGEGEVKGKSIAQSKNNNYIRQTPCLRNSIAYDQDFWYNCVKLWYLQAFFPFLRFSFFGLLGGKRAKNGPRWKKIMSVAIHISATMHHMILIYGTHV